MISKASKKTVDKLKKDHKQLWNRLGFQKEVLLWCDPCCDPHVRSVQEEPILAMNDCRLDINTKLTDEDKKYENVYFESYDKSFVPGLAVMSSRQIEVGEEIAVDYSNFYSTQMQQTINFEQMQNYVETLTAMHAMQRASLSSCL